MFCFQAPAASLDYMDGWCIVVYVFVPFLGNHVWLLLLYDHLIPSSKLQIDVCLSTSSKTYFVFSYFN